MNELVEKLLKGEEISLSVTVEDYDNSSRNFSSTINCPLAISLKRTFGVSDVLAGVNHAKILVDGEEIKMELYEKFGVKAYDSLVDDKIVFNTTIRLYDDKSEEASY